MSKTIVTLVILGVLVIGGYFVFKAKSVPDNGQVINTETSDGQKTETSGKKMAFSEFLKQGGSYKCTVSQNINNTETKGTTYINGEMIRGEYNTTVQGKNVDSTMIMRDGYTYSWTSMMPNTGFKMKIVASAPKDTSTTTPQDYGFNAEQVGDYSCEAWAPDQSKFTVPTNITFKEFGVQ